MEKISEKHLREEKVRKVKEKILKEIAEEVGRCKNGIGYALDYDDEEYFDEMIFRIHSLFRLKKYIEREYTFMKETALNYDSDLVIYTVSIDYINIWLQDDYNFVSEFIVNAEKEERNRVLIECMLNDEYFGIDFTSIFDKIAYDEKVKKETENND